MQLTTTLFRQQLALQNLTDQCTSGVIMKTDQYMILCGKNLVSYFSGPSCRLTAQYYPRFPLQ